MMDNYTYYEESTIKNFDHLYRYIIITERISLYLNPILIILGTVLNTLTIIVFCQKRLRALSVSVYTIALAISDICVLLFPILLNWLYDVAPHYTFFKTKFWCHTHGYLDMIFCCSSSWCVVAISSERWMAVCRPWKKRIYCTFERSIISVFVIVIFSILSSAWYPFVVAEFHLESTNGTFETSCGIRNEYLYKIVGAISIILIYIIPFTIISVLNCWIIHSLRVRSDKRKHLLRIPNEAHKSSIKSIKPHESDNLLTIETNEDRRPSVLTMGNIKLNALKIKKNVRILDTDQSINLMLVTVSLTFLVLTFPYQLNWIYTELYEIYMKTKITNDQVTSLNVHSSVLREITLTIRNINYVINFFLYSTMSNQFRYELVQLFHC